MNGVGGHASYRLPLPKPRNVRTTPYKVDYERECVPKRGGCVCVLLGVVVVVVIEVFD